MQKSDRMCAKIYYSINSLIFIKSRIKPKVKNRMLIKTGQHCVLYFEKQNNKCHPFHKFTLDNSFLYANFINKLFSFLFLFFGNLERVSNIKNFYYKLIRKYLVI